MWIKVWSNTWGHISHKILEERKLSRMGRVWNCCERGESDRNDNQKVFIQLGVYFPSWNVRKCHSWHLLNYVKEWAIRLLISHRTSEHKFRPLPALKNHFTFSFSTLLSERKWTHVLSLLQMFAYKAIEMVLIFSRTLFIKRQFLMTVEVNIANEILTSKGIMSVDL